MPHDGFRSALTVSYRTLGGFSFRNFHCFDHPFGVNMRSTRDYHVHTTTSTEVVGKENKDLRGF